MSGNEVEANERCWKQSRVEPGIMTASVADEGPEVERTMRGIRRAKGTGPNGNATILTPPLCQEETLFRENAAAVGL